MNGSGVTAVDRGQWKNLGHLKAFVLLGALAASLIAPNVAEAQCHLASFKPSSNYQVGEGAGKLTVTVGRDGPVGPGTIDYSTVDGSAKAGQDFTQTAGTLTYTNEEQLSFTVPITNDSTVEGNENFKVVLSNSTGCFVPSNNGKEAVATIQDDDQAAAPPPKNAPPAQGGGGESQQQGPSESSPGAQESPVNGGQPSPGEAPLIQGETESSPGSEIAADDVSGESNTGQVILFVALGAFVLVGGAVTIIWWMGKREDTAQV